MLMKLLGGFPLTDLAGLRFGFRCVPRFHKIEAWQTFRSESGFDSKLLAFGLKALGRSQDWSAWFFWGRQTAAVRIFVCKIDYFQNRNVYIFPECNLFLILKPILRNIVFGKFSFSFLKI
jgi:hypothetical protein